MLTWTICIFHRSYSYKYLTNKIYIWSETFLFLEDDSWQERKGDTSSFDKTLRYFYGHGLLLNKYKSNKKYPVQSPKVLFQNQ